jgi:hypothetical protein
VIPVNMWSLILMFTICSKMTNCFILSSPTNIKLFLCIQELWKYFTFIPLRFESPNHLYEYKNSKIILHLFRWEMKNRIIQMNTKTLELFYTYIPSRIKKRVIHINTRTLKLFCIYLIGKLKIELFKWRKELRKYFAFTL